MNDRLDQIRHKRARLIARAAAEREAASALCGELSEPLQAVDRLAATLGNLARLIKSHPLLPLAALAATVALLVSRRIPALKWVRWGLVRGFTAWQIYRSFKRKLSDSGRLSGASEK